MIKLITRVIPASAFWIATIMWVVFIVDALLITSNFNHFGIQPRTLNGLLGIAFSPFLHANLIHIISNTLPLIIISSILKLSIGSTRTNIVIVLSIIGSGLGTWMFSTAGVVVGASGLIYGLIGFLFANAYFSPSFRSWLIALLTFFLYGGTLASLFVVLPHVSWAGHAWGFISGILIAASMSSYLKANPHKKETSKEASK
jgi:membrane associated rhomboid family serine protease